MLGTTHGISFVKCGEFSGQIWAILALSAGRNERQVIDKNVVYCHVLLCFVAYLLSNELNQCIDIYEFYVFLRSHDADDLTRRLPAQICQPAALPLWLMRGVVFCCAALGSRSRDGHRPLR